jgi:hypothetical protein
MTNHESHVSVQARGWQENPAMTQSNSDTNRAVTVGAVCGTKVSATSAIACQPIASIDCRATVAVRSFNYAALPTEIAETLRGSVAAIGAIVRSSFIDVGNHLLRAKALLPRGEFGRWVEAELSMTLRSAENYMQAARFVSDKPEIVSQLPPTVLFALSAPTAPTTAVNEILAAAERGAMPPRKEIMATLRDAKWAEDIAKLKAKKSSKQITRQRRDREAAADRQVRQQQDLQEKRLLDEQERVQRLRPLVERIIANIGAADHQALVVALNNWSDNPTVRRLLREATVTCAVQAPPHSLGRDELGTGAGGCPDYDVTLVRDSSPGTA